MADTIYALASGAGRAGLAVVRISGPDADSALAALGGDPAAPPRIARRVRLADPTDGAALDDGLALRFPGPRSYTGEDVVELHIHGGPAVTAAVLDALGRQAGLRLAEPGEFTRRAVLAGKMDLTEAEGLLDLIEAETEAQRKQALRQAEGALGALYNGWRARLVAALAHLEAVIDFPDEDLPAAVEAELRRELDALRDAMAAHLADGHRGERLRHGVQAAIIGPPNAGKSSLLNLLARRQAAIVAATAGTTRDVIEVHLDLEGYPVLVADTAGIRAAGDAIEAEGVRRARQWAGAADLRVAVFAANEAPESAAAAEALIDEDTMVVLNKVDLGPAAWRPSRAGLGVFPVSVESGEGIAEFLDALGAAVRHRIGVGTAPTITRARHREAVAMAADALERAGSAALPELAAEDLRVAARALGRVTGAVDVEDLLDVIFRDFCIGK
jgi:tRNA modification GTPase